VFVLQQAPIVVRVVEEPVKETGIGDIIFGAIGLVGILLIAAAILGVALGGILIAVKRWRARHGFEPDPVAENPMSVSPR
jgi:hypothetical protein